MKGLPTTLAIFLLTVAPRLATAFTFQDPVARNVNSRPSLSSLFSSPPPKSPNDGGSGGSDDSWDADVDYDKEWVEDNQKSSIDPATSWDALPEVTNDMPKLGIAIGKQLKPLSALEASELKADATQVINDAIDAGIDDIETLRIQMKKELESNRKIQQFAAERNALEKSDELMTKIDKMTGDFLASTQTTRESTKLAAQASRAMEASPNQGLDLGTWGTLGGMTVVAGGLTESSTLLGSVANANRQASIEDATSGSTTTDASENRILVIADSKQDPLAKALLPSLIDQLQATTDIPNLVIDVVAPTATMPLGGDNAACVVIFCTSISQASSLSNMLDRLLRKTLTGGQIGTPPTQLVGISTVGTERRDKFPYSLQNMLGKLDQRRQIEEVILNTVRQRSVEPPLDYTLIKFGDIQKDDSNKKGDFQLLPRDVLDGTTSLETASQILVQAVAFQPFARNATMCATGSLDKATMMEQDEDFWEQTFLRLEGPEVWRSQESIGSSAMYGSFVEYIQGWADILATSGKGLTTPVRATPGIDSRSRQLLKEQDGVSLLFLPTQTGKNYVSRTEEKERAEADPSSKPFRRNVREGGVDVVVEVTKDDQLRVRARRCNYADDAVIKELSEETILKRLKEAVQSWQKEHCN